MKSERIEEYLEAVYKRQQKEKPVSTSSLAQDLGVSAPAVTDMLRSLTEKGLVEYEPNKGAVLTGQGITQALGIVRRHRLWERFLTDVLGLKWDQVHEEACKLEHIDSLEIEKGLSNILSGVETCPHGHSIPGEDGEIKNENALPLTGFKPQQQVRIIAVDKEEPGLLKEIDRLGLRPRAVISVLQKGEDGSMEVEVEKKKVRLTPEIASVLLARAVTGDEPAASPEELPLTKLEAGQSGIIKAYTGGTGSRGRCLSLGLAPGSKFKMVKNYHGGPLLVRVCDTDIALGRGLAGKIMAVKDESHGN